MEPVNEETLPWSETDRGTTAFRRKQLGRAAGSERLGASLYELPPGKRSWPYHYHTGNEEALYVLSGEGTLRVGDEDESSQYPLRAGDYVALPVGPESAHRVSNADENGDGGTDEREPLRYLVFSTMNDPDITVYPDSGKLGLYAGAAPGGDSEARVVDGYYPHDADVEYWEGEE
ncbi:cupin [Salinigranum rubrum]|uniref:Cupin n=1 Tax=Salinigranum rubrum TaxID=755307 RepID=A0A2I8VN95_9EURY|nr:cupin domain-containing protein [Salinigranum rubrum]AUV83407.1 cupin [Salinigranum rubrum]